jgi:hypothetical protein
MESHHQNGIELARDQYPSRILKKTMLPEHFPWTSCGTVKESSHFGIVVLVRSVRPRPILPVYTNPETKGKRNEEYFRRKPQLRGY